MPTVGPQITSDPTDWCNIHEWAKKERINWPCCHSFNFLGSSYFLLRVGDDAEQLPRLGQRGHPLFLLAPILLHSFDPYTSKVIPPPALSTITAWTDTRRQNDHKPETRRKQKKYASEPCMCQLFLLLQDLVHNSQDQAFPSSFYLLTW